jgi:hypothetical protein
MKHVRVERLGSLKQWTAMDYAKNFDPEEEVEVVEE